MRRFLGGVLVLIVVVFCLFAGAMAACTVGMPVMMLPAGSSNAPMVIWFVIIGLGAAAGLFFGIRAARTVFRSVTGAAHQTPPALTNEREGEER